MNEYLFINNWQKYVKDFVNYLENFFYLNYG